MLQRETCNVHIRRRGEERRGERRGEEMSRRLLSRYSVGSSWTSQIPVMTRSPSLVLSSGGQREATCLLKPRPSVLIPRASVLNSFHIWWGSEKRERERSREIKSVSETERESRVLITETNQTTAAFNQQLLTGLWKRREPGWRAEGRGKKRRDKTGYQGDVSPS